MNIPGYSIASRLGQGGMATVYLAVQHSFEREVALKVMSPSLNSDPSFAARFKREARIVAQLRHASIVPVFDVGEHESCHYLSMEYLPGGDLKRRILDRKGDLGLAVSVIVALSAALNEAHGKGFVHRDIKPENILFRADGTPVLTDFGIARALDSARAMTTAGMLVGTPDYMSPEQVKGLEIDGRSDLYSLGIVFYEILTGSVPFKADSNLSVALKQVAEPLPPLPPEYGAYQEFLDCLTNKERDERFASGAEVIRALRLIGGGRAATSRTGIHMLVAANATGTNIPRPPTSIQSIPTSATLMSQPTLAWPRQAPTAPPADSVTRPTQVSVSGYLTKLPSQASNPSGLTDPAAANWIGKVHSRLAKVDRPMWMGAVALLGLAVGVGFIISSLASDPHADTYVTVTQVAAPTTTSVPAPATASVPAPATTSVPAPPSAPAPQAQPPVPTGSAVASSNPSATQQAAVPVPIEQPVKSGDTGAHHKRLADERHRKEISRAEQIALAQAEELKQVEQTARLQAEEAQIQQWLADAKSEYAAGALWQPSGSSAADRYRDILKLQPGRLEALTGAQRVANVLAAEATRTLAVGDFTTTKQLVDQIQTLQPGNPQLAEVQSGLAKLGSSPTALDARDSRRLEKAARYIARAREDLGRTPLDFKALDDATDQYDKAQAAAVQAPGLSVLKERLIAAYVALARTEVSQQDAKRAQWLINSAHKHNWSSDELDQIEADLVSGVAPARPIQEAGTPAGETR